MQSADRFKIKQQFELLQSTVDLPSDLITILQSDTTFFDAGFTAESLK